MPADRTCTSPRWPSTSPGAAGESTCSHDATTRTSLEASRCAPACPSSTSTPDRRCRCPRTSCCRTCRRSPTCSIAPGPTIRRTSSMPTSGCRVAAALEAGRHLGLPVVQTFHALGIVKRRQQGARDTSPPGRLATEARLVRTVDHVIATCSDEVFELVRLGGDRSRMSVVPVRCGRRGIHARRPGRTPRAAAAPRRGQPVGRTQGHRQRHRRARRGPRHRAGDRRRPRTHRGRRRSRSPAAAPGRRRAWRRRPSRSARSAPTARAARCCGRPTPSCACRGTNRSASCRSKRWRAPGRWSPAPSADSSTPLSTV